MVTGMYFVLVLFNLVLIIVKQHSVTNFESEGQLIAGIQLLANYHVLS